MIDLPEFPYIEREFKDYALSLTGNANFLTIRDETNPKTKMYAVNAKLPFSEIAESVARIFPVAAITSCNNSGVKQLCMDKYPIMKSVTWLSNAYYFVFPLIRNPQSNDNVYGVQSPYNRMRYRVRQAFRVCCVCDYGHIQRNEIPSTLDARYYLHPYWWDDYTADRAADILLEVFENEHQCNCR